MKALFLTMAAAVPFQQQFISYVILAGAAVLVLAQLGLLPRGKTAERLKLDLEVSERELATTNAQLVLKEAEVALLKKQPNLDEHARLLAAMTHSFQLHDEKMMVMAARVEDIARAVIPKP